MLAISRAIERGELTAEIVLVASDRGTAPALEKARSRGLPTEVFSPKEGAPGAWALRMTGRLLTVKAELVVLAGFLRVLPPSFFESFEGRVVNTHPSLLPKFSGAGMYGTRVHAAVIASGDRTSGATVHVATAEVDRGPILAKAEIEVRPGETPEELSERQKPLEHTLLLGVLQRFARGELPLPFRSGP